MKDYLLGIDKINNVLNEFLAEFDITAELGTDFAYWYASGKITYSLVLPEGQDYFMNNFNRLAPDIKCDPFLASFLHEVGHNETLDWIEEAEEAYCDIMKKGLEKKLDKCIGDPKKKEELHQIYFDLPDEYEATMWAIEYMRENAEKVAEFWNKLQSAILEFYILNEVEVA